MKFRTNSQFTTPDNCPYITGETCINEYFLDPAITPLKLDNLLENGWRKFGPAFFRPRCPNCQECVPIRIPIKTHTLNKSQKRLLKKNQDIFVSVTAPKFKDEIYELYKKHSMERFKTEVNWEEFLITHFFPSNSGLQCEFYLDKKLIAVGFLDRTKKSLNSIYFIYDTDYLKRGLGIFGSLKEIEFAQKENIQYYYLGYYVASNSSMNYKNQFFPHEYYNWDKKKWELSPK
jgi:leucyl-tRNA---protein transferase